MSARGHTWQFGPVAIDAVGGEASVIELRVPQAGTINAIQLEQSNGAGGGTFRLFTKESAALAVLDSYSSASLGGGEPAEFGVFGAKTIIAGKFAEYQTEYRYRNRDSGYSNPTRKLYMIIEPTGSGVITFSLSMTIITDY